ncbi:MAG: hypothetical protein WC343_12005 [Bacilli bacterium]|jgi:Zn-dependent peptidase ImmA (M78 family)
MPNRDKDKFNVDALLDSLFTSEKLSDLFEKRIDELKISPTNALDILDIEYRALQGILQGTNRRIDVINFIKLASFLKIPKERVIKLYFDALEVNFPSNVIYPQNKIDFINENFDLANLFKAGFINNITNYPDIEERINSHFGLNSVFEYKLPSQDVAFSAGLKQPKNFHIRSFWINSAISAFKKIGNPYPYDQDGLMEYFPEIRQHSRNVDQGLIEVIRKLYKLGVTVFYQSSLPSLHLKGATLEINSKPCIIITDYKGYYTTLWHTLCHELSHVLFDFKEIKKCKYHISDDDTEQLTVLEKEKQADVFARQYLFSKEKLLQIKPHINNRKFINMFAEKNHVHPSFIYTYYAFEFNKEDPKAWAKAKVNNPSFQDLTIKVENPWTTSSNLSEHIKILKSTGIYN